MSACQADAATGTQPDGPDALRGEMVAREVRTGYSRCEGGSVVPGSHPVRLGHRGGRALFWFARRAAATLRSRLGWVLIAAR
jgi:hypothetical protein